jgi:YD repeat-containing protein
MGTHIFSGGNGEVSQVASAWTFDPAANVKLKTKGVPGTAWHKNSSGSLEIPLGTIKEHGTQVVNRYGAMDTGLHNPVPTLVGLFTNVVNKVNRYQTFVKSVVQEAGEMVVHGVTTLTNAILTKLSAALAATIKNGQDILGGMTAEHFKGAAKEEVEQLMEMLKDPKTYGGIAVSMAATAVQGIPVVGQVVGGAVAADRIIGMGQSAIDAATELKDIMGTWGQEMTPAQKENARQRLAKWMISGGASLLAALAGRKWKKSTQSTDKNDKSTTPQNSDKKKDGKGPCDQCALPHPVIISSGEKLLDETDFSLPGPIPISWRRRYRSGHRESSPWGQGWSHPFTLELRLGAQGLVHVNDQGRSIELPHVPVGHTHFDKFEKFTVHHLRDDAWVIEHKGGLCHHYRRARAEQWRLPLFGISDRQGNTVRLHWAAPDAVQDTAPARTWSARQYGSAPAAPAAPSDPFTLPRLVGVIDSAGRELRLRWSNVAETDAQSDSPSHSPDSARLVAVELLTQGQAHPLVTYKYDPQGQLTATHHAGQPYRQYAWRSGVLVGYRKASGHRYFAQYDQEGPQGRVLRSWCADASVPGQDDDHFEYRPLQRVTLHRDGLNRITRYHWDERFNITATVVAAGTRDETRIQTPFDASGNPSGSVDPLGRRTTYRYDSRGNLTQLTNALGHSTELSYNQLDLVVSLKDALGHAWQREYDERGNMIRLVDPLAQSTAYAYNERGWPTEVVDAKGGKKTLQWDEAGNLIAYTDCSKQTTRFTYDALGQLTQRQDALGHATQYRYDAAGRLVQVAEPGVNKNSDKDNTKDGTAIQHAIHQYTWNGEGQLLAYTDPLGGATRYTYDGDGRPLTRVDAAGRSLVYRYDAAGRLTTLVNENSAQTLFRYNLLDQLTDEIGFDGRHQRYVYNAAGELTHLIETGGTDVGPGKVTHFERDALGRLLAKRYGYVKASGADGTAPTPFGLTLRPSSGQDLSKPTLSQPKRPCVKPPMTSQTPAFDRLRPNG